MVYYCFRLCSKLCGMRRETTLLWHVQMVSPYQFTCTFTVDSHWSCDARECILIDLLSFDPLFHTCSHRKWCHNSSTLQGQVSGDQQLTVQYHVLKGIYLTFSLSLSPHTLESIQASKGYRTARCLSSFKASLLCCSKPAITFYHATYTSCFINYVTISIIIDSDFYPCVWPCSPGASEEAVTWCEMAVVPHPPPEWGPPTGRILWQEALLVWSWLVNKAL